jgi:hypothetical protein
MATTAPGGTRSVGVRCRVTSARENAQMCFEPSETGMGAFRVRTASRAIC